MKKNLKIVTAVILAVVFLFLGLLGQLNIVQATGPTKDFTVTGTRFEGDSYSYSDTVSTPKKIKSITVNNVNQGSAVTEITDGGYGFRLKFSGGTSYIISGDATGTYKGTVITDCTNDTAYIEVPINKYVTEIINIQLKGGISTTDRSTWEISHPDSSSSIIRFKAINGNYIPHSWYKTVENIPKSKIKKR